MRTLTVKHNGYEAHVPYELPSGLWFDCFIPGHGIRPAHVDPRSDTITVDCVDGLDEFCSHDAVLDQAGDVVRTFLEALPIEWSECEKAENESAVAFVHRANLIESSWKASTRPSDMAILSAIAEMALLESDLHTAWSRLSEAVWVPLSIRPMGPDDTRLPSRAALHSFIINVLVPRAQDMATAAAKRREAEWVQEMAHQDWQAARSAELDLAIDIAKERV